MKHSSNINRFFKSGLRKLARIIKNKKVRKAAYASYHMYGVVRIFRNPFVILQYLNVYNALLLIQ